MLRSGARAGDVVAHAGVAGWSAAGLALLDADASQADAELVAALPRPELAAGRGARGGGRRRDRDARRVRRAAAGRGPDRAGERRRSRPAGPRGGVRGRPGRGSARSPGARCVRSGLGPRRRRGPRSARHVPAGRGPAAAVPGGRTVLGGTGVLVDGRPQPPPSGWDHFGGAQPEPGSPTTLSRGGSGPRAGWRRRRRRTGRPRRPGSRADGRSGGPLVVGEHPQRDRRLARRPRR